MKHALKPTLAAMLLVPAVGLGMAANAAAQTAAPRANRADTTSAVTHGQMMRGMNGAGTSSMQGTQVQGMAASDMSRNAASSRGQSGGSSGMASADESDPKMYIFDALDANHDGKLSRTEIAHDANLARQARSLDRNHDGNISRQEFSAYKR